MNRDAVISTLKEAETALRSRCVNHAALFGSVARDQVSRDSNIDNWVDLDPKWYARSRA